MEQDLAQFAVLMLCDYFTGCDEMGDCFAAEADTMIDIVYEVSCFIVLIPDHYLLCYQQ